MKHINLIYFLKDLMKTTNTFLHFKNVLCIYPYRKELSSMGFMPPLGLEYIATVLKEFSEKIDIVDLRYEKRELSYFLSNKPDLVCISINWSHEKNSIRKLVREIPSHIFTIVGGRAASDDVDNLFRECPNIDIIVRGEGENTVRELLGNKPLDEISSLNDIERVFKSQKGKLKRFKIS